MIKLGERGRISCDHNNCKAGMGCDLVLTVHGTFIAIPPPGWQTMLRNGNALGTVFTRCPEHRVETPKIKPATAEETKALES